MEYSAACHSQAHGAQSILHQEMQSEKVKPEEEFGLLGNGNTADENAYLNFATLDSKHPDGWPDCHR